MGAETRKRGLVRFPLGMLLWGDSNFVLPRLSVQRAVEAPQDQFWGYKCMSARRRVSKGGIRDERDTCVSFVQGQTRPLRLGDVEYGVGVGSR